MQKRIAFTLDNALLLWFQSVYAFTIVSRQDDELGEPNLYKKIDKHKIRQKHSRHKDLPLFCQVTSPPLVFSAYMLRLIKQHATDGVYLAHDDVPAKEDLTNEMTRQKLD